MSSPHLACTLTIPLFCGLVAKCCEQLSHWALSLSHIGIGWVGFPLSSYKAGVYVSGGMCP